MYPNEEGSTFDFEYYRDVHCTLSKARFGNALKGMSLDSGVSGILPDSNPPYHAVGHHLFEPVDGLL